MHFKGSIFLLAAIAVAKLCARVRDEELAEDVLLRINHVIRCPDHSMFTSLSSVVKKLHLTPKQQR